MKHHVTLRSLCCFVYLVFVSTLIEFEATKTEIKDSNTPQSHINHDVFISFRGSDIRQGFLSHLVYALHEKQIIAFVDNQIHKGDEIAQSLFQAIETSLISLVIFSQNYASSRWCLDELVKIVECREKNGQILLPVFYKVDPTIVRYQNGTYANAFAEHEKKFNLTKVQEWKSVLKECASISGYPSSMYANDSELLKEIVQYVLSRLDDIHKYKPHSKRVLTGLGNQISHVKSLLLADSKDVRAIGIWGMAGIGKTTIAEEVFDRLCSEYESCYFMADIREEWGRHGRMHLKKKLYSSLLRNEDLNIEKPHGLPYFVERRLQLMKVLVVLDDVGDKEQLEILIGTLEWFGKGSRIIITTSDKQVLAKRVDDNDIYKLKPLDFDDSFQLFILTAFGQNHSKMEYDKLLLEKIVNYAQGIPLVLKELGYFIGGKDRETWKSECEKLTREPLKNVHDAIRLSCNYLNGVDEIVECREKDEQILVTLPYETYTRMGYRRSSRTYQDAFAEHGTNLTAVKELRYEIAGGTSGHPFSWMFGTDSVLVKEIDQYARGNILDFIHMHVESLLSADSKDVRAIGIWGMTGIWKTTIGEEVFERLCSEYDSCYFKANVREEWERDGRMHLKNELYSALLKKEDLNIERPHGLPYFVERRLRRMKVLVVLDNVSDEEQLEILIETLDWFGRGSRIIITSRDKQVFLNRVDDNDVYEVEVIRNAWS